VVVIFLVFAELEMASVPESFKKKQARDVELAKAEAKAAQDSAEVIFDSFIYCVEFKKYYFNF
jgi:hypothetical protein